MVYKLFHSTEETKESSLKLCKEMSSAIFFLLLLQEKLCGSRAQCFKEPALDKMFNLIINSP